jgi:hypothetical protein
VSSVAALNDVLDYYQDMVRKVALKIASLARRVFGAPGPFAADGEYKVPCNKATVVARSWVLRFRMMILSVDASIEQATWHALGKALSGAAKNAELVR